MKVRTRAMLGVAALAAVAMPATVSAQVAWTDWLAASQGTPGSANGTLMVNGTPVNVRYVGEVGPNTQTSGGGIDYWAPGNAYVTTGRPTGTDIITLTGGNQITNTIFFDTPVVDPFMAILSLGQPNVHTYYNFNTPFTIVGSGCGYWGGNCAGSLFTTAVANQLDGLEGHGVIQFNGTYSSISWTVPDPENWHGFQVGVTATPEPASLVLLGTGLLGVFAVGRKRRS